MTRLALLILIVTTVAAPARAQLVVHDPGNFAQAILIAERTLREYDALMAQYQTLLRMSRGLGRMDRYRLPTVPTTAHDPGQWTYGGRWLEGLNQGDPRGTLYRATTRPLDRPGATLAHLPPTARHTVEQAYATVDITDSVAGIAGDAIGRLRASYGRIQQSIDALQDDVLDDRPAYHEMTAILDKIAAGELIARQQDTATNQLLSHALEQALVRSKRLRDAEAATMNMRVGGLRDGRTAGASVVRGAADALRTWRQP